MPNMKSVIDNHNNNIIKSQLPKQETKPCNCRKKPECPLSGKCRASSIIYQAIVKSDKGEESYVGLTKNEFKQRLANHNQSFKNEAHKHQTELAKHIWNLKDNNINFTIKWKILKYANAYSNVSKRCNLCIMEKYFIICHPKMASLNKKNELISACRHAANFKLKNLA